MEKNIIQRDKINQRPFIRCRLGTHAQIYTQNMTISLQHTHKLKSAHRNLKSMCGKPFWYYYYILRFYLTTEVRWRLLKLQNRISGRNWCFGPSQQQCTNRLFDFQLFQQAIMKIFFVTGDEREKSSRKESQEFKKRSSKYLSEFVLN